MAQDFYKRRRTILERSAGTLAHTEWPEPGYPIWFVQSKERIGYLCFAHGSLGVLLGLLPWTSHLR